MSNILKRINFIDRYNEVEPVSLNGKAIKQAHLKKIGANKTSHLMVSNILNECQTSKDEVLVGFANSIINQINENAQSHFQLGMLKEMTESVSEKNLMVKPLLERLSKLEEMEPSVLNEALQQGALSDFVWYGPAKQIHEHYHKQTIKISDTHTVYTPVSYVEVSESEKTYFNIEGRTYMTTQGQVLASDGGYSEKFVAINEAISNIPYDPNKKSFFADTLIGQAVINQNGDLTINGIPCSVLKFNESMQDAITTSTLNESKLKEQAKTADRLIKLVESFENIMELDSVRVGKSQQFLNESMACMVFNDESYLIKFSGHVTRFNKHETINESMTKFKEFTGISLNEAFNTELSKETAFFESQQNQLSEITEAEAEVKKAMDGCDNGSPRHGELVALLDQLNEEKKKLVIKKK